jgi:hypothetical protein
MECYKETQERLKEAITLLFQEKSREHPGEHPGEDPPFLNQFVAYCTGQSYIPDIDLNPDFKILIEFNYTEMLDDHLPVVHTCVKTMKLPASAYDSNIETFQQKLSQAMEFSKGSFDMN